MSLASYLFYKFNWYVLNEKVLKLNIIVMETVLDY